MKLRISRDEWARVQACADVCGVSAGDWLAAQSKSRWRHVRKDMDGGVGCDREKTTTVCVNTMLDAQTVRAAMRIALGEM